MSFFYFLIILILFIFLKGLFDKISSIEKELRILKLQLKPTSQTPETGKGKTAEFAEPHKDEATISLDERPTYLDKPVDMTMPVDRPPSKIKEEIEEELAIKEESVIEEDARKRRAEKWSTIEQKIAENWTGILGAVAMVAGVGFLGIYTALKFSPMYRFLMMVIFSAILFGIFYALKLKERWMKFANWLGSSSMAIFLFACYGAGNIQPIRWIYDPLWSITLIAFALAANLCFAYIGGTQTFASLHTILCVTALIMSPDNTSLVLVTLVCIASIAFSYKYKWDQHLFIVLSSFFLFELYWQFTYSPFFFPPMTRMIGVSCISAVGIAAALIHYRKDYASTSLKQVPFVVHVINWLYMGTGLSLLATDLKLLTIPLAVASVAAYLLARKGKALGVIWVYRTDTLLSQVLALLSIYSLNIWGVDMFVIIGLIFVQGIIFSLLMLREADPLLSNIALKFTHLAGLILLISGLFCKYYETVVPLRIYFTLCVTILAALFFHIYTRHHYAKDVDDISLYLPARKEKVNTFSLVGILTGCLVIPVYINLLYITWAGYIVVFIISIIILIGTTLRSGGLITGVILSTAVFHIITFIKMISASPSSQWLQLGVLGLLTISTILLVYLNDRREKIFLSKESIYLMDGSLFFFILSLLTYFNSLSRTAALIGLEVGIVGILFHLYSLKKFGESYDGIIFSYKNKGITISVFGILLGILPVAIFATIAESTWAEGMMIILMGCFIYMRHRLQGNGLGLGMILGVTGISILSWNSIYKSDSHFFLQDLLRVVPLIIMSVMTARFSFCRDLHRYLKWPGIYLAGINVMIGSYLLSVHFSTLLPGILWLIFSVIAVELASISSPHDTKETGQASRFILHVGYIFILAFIVRHFIVHIQAEVYLGLLKARLLIALFAITVFIYWLIHKCRPGTEVYKSWVYLHPLFLELIFIFSALTVALEVKNVYLPLSWTLLALASFLISRYAERPLSRLRLYSLFFFWASTFHLAVIVSTIETPFAVWYLQPWFWGTATLIFEIVYLILINSKSFLKDLTFPPSIIAMTNLTEKINKNKNLWIYYPFFICTAVYLYWRFDAAILTLLFVIECFVIFALGIRFNIHQFITVSLAALAVCNVRLILFDLAKTNTLTKGIVFLGVGLLMLTMNFTYRKYYRENQK